MGKKFDLGRITLFSAAFGNNYYLDGRIFTPASPKELFENKSIMFPSMCCNAILRKNGGIPFFWQGRIGEYHLSPERLGDISTLILVGRRLSVVLAPNLEGIRRYSLIHSCQTHGICVVVD